MSQTIKGIVELQVSDDGMECGKECTGMPAGDGFCVRFDCLVGAIDDEGEVVWDAPHNRCQACLDAEKEYDMLNEQLKAVLKREQDECGN
ncbi:MAG TPA: hypothetical protein ENH82_11425 [bacterium]|nr:hypothetical protein [bacterium]